MPEPLFIDLQLSRALELAEAASSRAFCETAAGLYPDKEIRALPCAGGVGLYYGPGDPLNAVKGVGLNGPVRPEEWDALEAAFRDRDSPVVIDLSPFADSAFVALLGARGYRIGSFETVTCRRLDTKPVQPPSPITGCVISPPGDPSQWSRVLDVGFANGGEPMKFAVDIGLVRARLPHVTTLLATIDGVPAGGAGMSIHQGVAHLSGCAVLPAYRNRGLQAALTIARLNIAGALGCILAKFDVHAGSGSYRNAVRAGFQVAYTRPQLVRSW